MFKKILIAAVTSMVISSNGVAETPSIWGHSLDDPLTVKAFTRLQLNWMECSSFYKILSEGPDGVEEDLSLALLFSKNAQPFSLITGKFFGPIVYKNGLSAFENRLKKDEMGDNYENVHILVAKYKEECDHFYDIRNDEIESAKLLDSYVAEAEIGS